MSESEYRDHGVADNLLGVADQLDATLEWVVRRCLEEPGDDGAKYWRARGQLEIALHAIRSGATVIRGV